VGKLRSQNGRCLMRTADASLIPLS
jgi:hypothetical protein